MRAGIGVADLVGAIQTAPVPLKIHLRTRTGTVVAVDHKQGKPGSGLFNDVDLPTAKDRVFGAVPRTAKRLALAKRQVIKDAGGKIVIQVDLREAPIRLTCTGERPVSGTREGAIAIGHSGVK